MKNRFEVSTEGMAELQSGREPWQLAKELISNAWDERTTLCDVTLEHKTGRKSELIVQDDGDGFSKIEDVWTLMGHTPKRANPNARGRFNLGDKEILSVAVEATIRTAGKIICFPKEGGRTVTADPIPQKGTVFSCILPWTKRQVEETVTMLKTLLPPRNILYRVNGEAIRYQKPDTVTEYTLETQLSPDGPGSPLRYTHRKSAIEITKNGGTGTLFEMGIPIQPIGCPYKVNVMQKVPMPPNRDVVRDSYLRDIYSAVLIATINDLKYGETGETWVRIAVGNKDMPKDVVREVLEKRYGDKVMLWSSDPKANEKA